MNATEKHKEQGHDARSPGRRTARARRLARVQRDRVNPKFVSVVVRFLGVDIQYRRQTNSRSKGTTNDTNEWPHPWRIRLVTTKNERGAYRITVFGLSLEMAMDELVAAVERVDTPGEGSPATGG